MRQQVEPREICWLALYNTHYSPDYNLRRTNMRIESKWSSTLLCTCTDLVHTSCRIFCDTSVLACCIVCRTTFAFFRCNPELSMLSDAALLRLLAHLSHLDNSFGKSWGNTSRRRALQDHLPSSRNSAVGHHILPRDTRRFPQSNAPPHRRQIVVATTPPQCLLSNSPCTIRGNMRRCLSGQQDHQSRWCNPLVAQRTARLGKRPLLQNSVSLWHHWSKSLRTDRDNTTHRSSREDFPLRWCIPSVAQHIVQQGKNQFPRSNAPVHFLLGATVQLLSKSCHALEHQSWGFESRRSWSQTLGIT